MSDVQIHGKRKNGTSSGSSGKHKRVDVDEPNIARYLIRTHLTAGIKPEGMKPGKEIALKMDQTYCQDATGTLVALELDAMGLERTKAEISAQYVDHNLLQTDTRNQEDHIFLQSAAKKFGYYYSAPGNGVGHPVHMERFDKPLKSLIGSDSHTCAAGSMCMLAMGAGGLNVAAAIAGEPFYIRMPKIIGVKLTGKLPDWVSAKDVILEMLRRRDVKGAVECIIEYYGEGVKNLTAMDRHVIANMGAELGATATVFPSDEQTLKFLKQQQREEDYIEVPTPANAKYDIDEHIELDKLEPLIAKPGSPGYVVPIKEVAGTVLSQAVIGSSANPGLRDFWIVAEILDEVGQFVPRQVSLDINPSSRAVLKQLVKDGQFSKLLEWGGRIHQSGCLGCIGIGQAPAKGKASLRTFPRNFPGRAAGGKDEQVYLCSPETAVASAIMGVITDPRQLPKIFKEKGKNIRYPKFEEPPVFNHFSLVYPPLPPEEAKKEELEMGSNIKKLPDFDEMPDTLETTVILKLGDNVSTDEIAPAGSVALGYRSNVPKFSEFVFINTSPEFQDRIKEYREEKKFSCIVGGENYGQGSSREHAAVAPRYLGVRMKLAKSFARIHYANLVQFGILPLSIESGFDAIKEGDVLKVEGLHEWLDKIIADKDGSKEEQHRHITVKNTTQNNDIKAKHMFSPRMAEMLRAGSYISFIKKQKDVKQEDQQELKAEKEGKVDPDTRGAKATADESKGQKRQ